MALFDIKITRQRFAVPGYSVDQMVDMASKLEDSIKSRLGRGMTVDDAPAPPLSKGYSRFKRRNHPPAVRNLRFTGLTLSTMQVVSAANNRAVVGFVGPKANMIIAVNNRRVPQFGVSPRDAQALAQARQKANASGPPVRISDASKTYEV